MESLVGLGLFALVVGYVVYKKGVKKGWWNKVDLKNMFK